MRKVVGGVVEVLLERGGERGRLGACLEERYMIEVRELILHGINNNKRK